MLRLQHNFCCRDHSGYALSQWEMLLKYNTIWHWLSPYPEWSLCCEKFSCIELKAFYIPFILEVSVIYIESFGNESHLTFLVKEKWFSPISVVKFVSMLFDLEVTGYLWLYSLSEMTFDHEILRCLKATRLGVKMIISLWDLTGILAAVLSICLSNFKVIRKY